MATRPPRFLITVLWGLATPCLVTVESTWFLPSSKAACEAGELLGDGSADLIQKTASHVGALLGQELGNWRWG